MSASLGVMMLGLQAAGTALDYFGVQQQKELGRLGERVNQSQIDLNIEAARTSAAEASLIEMRNLRSNLSSQFAAQIARGTNPGIGSAMFVSQKSEQIASEDERARQLNLDSQVTSLHASGFLSSLHQTQTEIKASSDFVNRVFQQIPSQAGLSGLSGAGGGGGGFGLAAAGV